MFHRSWSLLAVLVLAGCGKDIVVGTKPSADAAEGGGDAFPDGAAPIDSGDPGADGAPGSGGDAGSNAATDGAVTADWSTWTDAGVGAAKKISSLTGVIFGVTRDDYAILGTGGVAGLHAVSLSDGTAASVDPAGYYTEVSSKVVFSWGLLDSYGRGPLSVWTAATGTHAMSANTLCPLAASDPRATALADGSYVAYLANIVAKADGDAGSELTGDVVVAKSDGTEAATVFHDVDVWGHYCKLSMKPAGNSFLVVHCGVGGNPVADLVSTAGVVTHVATDAAFADTGDAGDAVFVISSKGVAQLVPTKGGAPVTIDSGLAVWVSTAPPFIGAVYPPAFAAMTPDGATMFYAKTAASGVDLMRASATSAKPETIAAGVPLMRVYGFSSTFSQVMYATHPPSELGADIVVVPTAAGSKPIQLADPALMEMDRAGFVDPFTIDGSHAIFQSAMDTASATETPMVALSTGGVVGTYGSGVRSVRPVAGTKVVIARKGDLAMHDVAGTAKPSVVATHADSFALNPTRTKLVYTTSSGASPPGLYVLSVP